jgi:HK97 family phage prohead protease
MQLETPMFGNAPTDGGEFVILKENKECVIAGYASVDVVDKQNDKITLNAIRDAADGFMKNDRFRNVMITHSNVQVGEVLDNYTDSKGKVLKTGVDDTGFFVVIKLRNDIEKAKEVARDIRRGKLRSFSIGGQAINKANKYDPDVGSYKEIDKLELHEITICEEGINPEAKFNIIKEDKKMSEIEKALAEFNDVMAELKNTVLLKDDDDDSRQGMKMEEAGTKEKMNYGSKDDEMKEDDAFQDEEMADYEMGDYMKEEDDDMESLEYMRTEKGVETLDLSPSNLEKAYEHFRAEKEEERAYDLVKAEFEARYAKELELEKQEIAKSKFNAQSELEVLREELSSLKKSLENNEIAKAQTVEETTRQLSEDFSRVGEMSWDEVHSLFSKHEGGI